jgi:hypothetical protein
LSHIIEGKKDQEILSNFLGPEYYNKFQIVKNKIKDPDYKDIYKLITKNQDEVKRYIDNVQSQSDKVKEDKKVQNYCMKTLIGEFIELQRTTQLNTMVRIQNGVFQEILKDMKIKAKLTLMNI